MTSVSIETAILAALVVGPILYLAVIAFSRPPATFEAYYYANREVRAVDFIDSTISYALQVAVISLFATWGYLYGFWTMLVPFFWGLGYVVIASMIRFGYVDELILSQKFTTLHDFLGSHGRFKSVAVVASLITLAGISGPAMFEASFVSEFVSEAIADGSTDTYLLLFAAFLSVSAVYMLHSGFKGVVLTDQLQLAIGYVAFNVAFFVLILLAAAANQSAALLVSLLALIFAFALLTAKILTSRSLGQGDVLSYLSASSGVLLYGASSAMLLMSDKTVEINIGQFLTDNLQDRMPLLAILSLFVANGFYQLVDVGHWQRLLSLQEDRRNLGSARSTMSTATLSVAIQSPATWAIAVLFGILLKYLIPDADPWNVLSELSNYFRVEGLVLLAFVFTLSLAAIMFSTLDSLISAVSFTVHNDILLNVSRNLRSKIWGQLVTAALLLIMFLYYLTMKGVTADNFDAILYLSWSFQIALLPSVIGRFFTIPHAEGKVLLLSIGFGCIAASIPFWFGQPAKVYEWSPLLSLAASSIILLIAPLLRTLFRTRSNETQSR